LFTGAAGAEPKVAVVNVDDPYGEKLAGVVPAHVKKVTFGENPAAMCGENVVLGFKNTTFKLVWRRASCSFDSRDRRYNVSNLSPHRDRVGLGRDRVFLARLGRSRVAGRMERIEEASPTTCWWTTPTPTTPCAMRWHAARDHAGPLFVVSAAAATATAPSAR